MQDYFCYMLHYKKDQPNPYISYGALSAQARVDARACIDENRISYYVRKQDDIRMESIQGICDAVSRGATDGKDMGKMTVLPASFTGGRRYMIQNYHDGIALCREFGPPDFFVTFTCNPKWLEILEAIFDRGMKPSDRSDAIVRVFNMKLEELLHDIKNGAVFGPCSAVLHTVEFQKRGLPHAHIILWTTADTSHPTPSMIDTYISAEIPDPRIAGNIVVCLLVGCTPRQEYRTVDKVYLSASSPFAYHLNPKIPEATPFYSRFKDTPIYIKRPAQETRLLASPVADRPLRLMTIAKLEAITDPFDFQNGAYKCAINITSIPANVNWWYMSCKQHKNSAVRQSDLTYRCPVCSKPATLPRYALSFIGRDDTGEARFFAFDDAAGSLIGRECEAVMSPLGQANGLPQALQNIINKRYVVAVNLSDSVIRQYVVRRVLERPPRRPAQAGADGSSSQAQASASQVLQSPSKSMSALMLHSPQKQQNTLRLEPVIPLTPVHSIEDGHNTSPQAVNSPAQISTACRNLFGRQEASDMAAALSDTDEAVDEETDTQPARGKRRKSSAKTTAKLGSKKHATSDN